MHQDSFGYWLKRRRKALDLTQEELARQVGCSAAAIRKMEAEERRPSAQIVERLRTIFNIPTKEQESFLRFARGDLRAAPADSPIESIEGFPWRASPKSTRSNLPASPNSLIGREQEIVSIQESLLKSDVRLVTLIGPPGIGKTRLSIDAARACLRSFPDGAFFVALAPLEDSGLISHAVVQSLGFVESGTLSIRKQLLEGVRDKEMLLVLDNCEHLIEEVASTVSDLISACSRLKILATSRESLRVAGEWLYPVPSFDIPNQVSSVNMETASQFAALTLFAERARAVRPDFTLSSGNVQTITTICRQLDGVPLAIELMAARMRLMSPQALLERMSDEFILSVDGMRAAATRQKTLNNAIDWSYNLLSAEEQILFAYLSVFSGGFTLDAAENMFSQIFPGPSVATLITLLLDKSLVQRTVDGEPRFTMLATIQEFSRKRLRERSEETDIQNLHLAYFLDLAEQADREIHGPSQTAWMQRLDLELENFRAALEWGLSSGRTDQLLRLFAALGWTWMVRWSPSESRSWLDKIRTLPDLAQYPLFHVKILNDVIHQEWVAANFDETRSLIEESQAICLKLGKDGEHRLAEVLYLSGLLASQEAQYRRGWSDVEQSFDLYHKYGDSWGMAFTRFLLGHLATMMDEDSSAQMYLQQSMDLFKKLEDPWGVARVAQRLGELFLKQGSYKKAGQYFVQHLELDESLQFKQGIAVALSNLGNLYRLQQDYDQAEGFYRKSLKISDEYNLTIDRGYNWFNLGTMALRRNQYPIAIQFFTNYFKTARKYLEKISTCDFLVASAAIAACLNQPERAARLYGAAQMLLETMEYRLPPFDQAEFQRHIEISHQQLGDAKFESLAAEGRSMLMEQAIAYALDNSK